MATQTITFTTLAYRNFDRLGNGDVFSFDELDGLRGSHHIQDRNFMAIVGDGDGEFEDGETAHKLSDMGYGGRVRSLDKNATETDPVFISAHGRISNGEIGDLTKGVRFTKKGFGVDNGPDGSGIRYLNDGDSLTFDTRAEYLSTVTFSVNLRDTSANGSLLFDIDGSVMTGPNGESEGSVGRGDQVQDALFALDGLTQGQTIEIDYFHREIRVDGVVQNGTDAFFDATESSTGDKVTIGSMGSNGIALDDLSLTVSDVPPNTPPIAVDDVFDLSEDTLLDFTAAAILGNDTDPNGDTLELQGALDQSGLRGSILDNGDGTFTYQHDPAIQELRAGETVTTTAIYTVTDGRGETDTGTITFRIAGADDAPEAMNDTASVNEDGETTLDLLANDTDAEGGVLSISSWTQPDFGSVSYNEHGILTYRPNENFHGEDIFFYEITDDTGLTSMARVDVTVNAVNDAPVAGDDSAATNGSTPVLINVLGNDTDIEDGNALTILSVDTPANGTATIENGQIRYTPNAGFSGQEVFRYVVQDSDGGTDTANVTVNVNTDPVAVYDALWTSEGNSGSINVLDNDTDADGDTLTVIEINGEAAKVGTTFVSDLGAHVTLNADGTFRYDATDVETFDVSALDGFSYTISDGKGGTHDDYIDVYVNPQADTAVFGGVRAGNVTEDSNTAATGTVTVSDPDANGSNGLGLFVAENVDGAHGTLQIDKDGNWSYAVDNSNDAVQGIAAGATLVDTITVTQQNTRNFGIDFGGETTTIDITVNGVNDDPDGVYDYVWMNEGQVKNGSLLANDVDVDGDALTIVAIDGDADLVGSTITTAMGASVTINADGSYTYDATDAEPSGFSSQDAFTYTVSDGKGGTDVVDTFFDVSSVNDAPVTSFFTVSTDEDSQVTFSVLDLGVTDPDPSDTHAITIDSMSIYFGNIPSGDLVDNGDGTFTYTPSEEAQRMQEASDDAAELVTYTVRDAAGVATTGQFDIFIKGLNDAPVAIDDSVATDEDTAITIDVLANDEDRDLSPGLTIQNVGTASNGTTEIVGNRILYTPDADFNGTDSFTYGMTDEHGATDTATVSVTVNPVNDDPHPGSPGFAITEDESLTFAAADLLAHATDVDGDALSIVGGFREKDSSHVPEAGGSISLNPDGSFSYVHGPDAQALGESDYAADFFEYTVSDGNGGTATADLYFFVGGLNDAPVANLDDASTPEDATTPIVIDVLANDSDADGDVLTITSAYGAEPGATLEIVDNKLHYTPGANFYGVNYLKYTVDDGNGGTDDGSVQISVTGINDDPVAGFDLFRFVEDPVVGTIRADQLLANDSDVDFDTLFIDGPLRLVRGADTVVSNSDGTFTFTGQDAQYLATDDYVESLYEYTVSDGNGGTDIGTVIFRQEGRNDDPVATDDAVNADEDVTAVFSNLLDNDSDVDDGAVLSILSVESTGNGTAELQSDGSVHYTSAPDFVGQDMFTYVVQDEHGATDTATVTVNVTNTPDAPMGVDDTAEVEEDSSVTIDVLANDSDIDGNALNLVSAGDGANGTTAIVDGKVVYTPNANFHGTDSFTYVVGDGGLTDTATVNVTVNDDPPQARPDTYRVDDNSTLNVNVLDNDSDPDGDPLTVVDVWTERDGTIGVGVTGSSTGIRVESDGTLTFDATSGYEFDITSLETLTYTIEDSNGNRDTESVEIYIDPAADAATFGGDLTGDVTDDGSPTLTTSGIATIDDVDDFISNTNGSFGADQFQEGTYAGSYGSLTIDKDGNWTYEADRDQADIIALAAGESMVDSVVVEQTSPLYSYFFLGGETTTIDVTIHGGNDIPTPEDDSYVIGDNDLLVVNVLGNDGDPDGDTLRVVSVEDEHSSTPYDAGVPTAERGIVIAEDGTLTFDASTIGIYDSDITFVETLTYTVEDVHGVQSTATIDIQVNPADDQANFGGDLSGSVTEDTDVETGGFLVATGTATVSDPDRFLSNSNGNFGPDEFVLETISGTYGSLTIEEDGDWIYTADNSQSAIQDLGAGESLVDLFTVSQVDSGLAPGLGGAVTSIEVTIYGLDG